MRLLIVSLAICLSGCASTSEFRNLAALTEKEIAAYQKRTADFASESDKMIARNDNRIARHRAAAVVNRELVDATLFVWNAGGKDRNASIIERVRASMSAEQAVSNLQQRSTRPAPLSTAAIDAPLAAALEGQAVLSADPSLADRIRSVAEIVIAAKGEFERLAKEAEAAKAEAEEAAAKADADEPADD